VRNLGGAYSLPFKFAALKAGLNPTATESLYLEHPYGLVQLNAHGIAETVHWMMVSVSASHCACAASRRSSID
jgi:hypothetical protein